MKMPIEADLEVPVGGVANQEGAFSREDFLHNVIKVKDEMMEDRMKYIVNLEERVKNQDNELSTLKKPSSSSESKVLWQQDKLSRATVTMNDEMREKIEKMKAVEEQLKMKVQNEMEKVSLTEKELEELQKKMKDMEKFKEKKEANDWFIKLLQREKAKKDQCIQDLQNELKSAKEVLKEQNIELMDLRISNSEVQEELNDLIAKTEKDKARYSWELGRSNMMMWAFFCVLLALNFIILMTLSAAEGMSKSGM